MLICFEYTFNPLRHPPVHQVCESAFIVSLIYGPHSMLDDGLTVRWSPTQRDAPFEKCKVSADNLAVRSWGLAHQAGVFTYPHQDADSDAIYIIGMSGIKMWTFYFICDPSKSRNEILSIITKLINTDETEHPDLDAETVYLYPRDLLYVFNLFQCFC